jgi:catechol 2,3-dioxygenase-like lactoylglutathione lyase family enzyme
MTSAQASSADTAQAATDLKLEVVVVPVADVDRAKRFYTALGWRLDADFATSDEFRVLQVTPPGSETSVIFGKASRRPRPAPSRTCS